MRRLLPYFRADRLGGQTVITFGLRIWGAAAAFALSWLVARHFGPAGVGLYGLAITTVLLVHYLVLVGLDYTLVRVAAGDVREGRRDAARGAVRAAGRAVLTIAPLVMLALWLAREPVAARLLGQPAAAPVLGLMLLAVAPLALQRIASAALRVGGQPLASQLIDGPVGTTLAAAALAGLILAGYAGTLLTPVALYVAGTVVSAGTGWLLWRRLRRDWPAAAPAAALPLLIAGLPVLGSNLSNMFTEWWTTVTLGAAWPAAVVGQYRVAWQIVGLAGMLQAAMDTMLGPRIAAAARVGDKAAIARTTRRAVLLVVALATPLFAVIFAVPERLLGVFGPGFVGGALTLQVLAAGQLVRLASGPLGTIIIMTGNQRWLLLYGLAGVVLCVGFSMWLIPTYGAVGAAAATAATVTLRNLAAGLLVRFGLGIDLFGRSGG